MEGQTAKKKKLCPSYYFKNVEVMVRPFKAIMGQWAFTLKQLHMCLFHLVTSKPRCDVFNRKAACYCFLLTFF